MTVELLAAALAGVIWGGIWALVLQSTAIGRYLVSQLTWLTVVIGFGGCLLILLFVLPIDAWLTVLAVIGAAGLPIVGRSLYNMMREVQDTVTVLGDRRNDN